MWTIDRSKENHYLFDTSRMISLDEILKGLNERENDLITNNENFAMTLKNISNYLRIDNTEIISNVKDEFVTRLDEMLTRFIRVIDKRLENDFDDTLGSLKKTFLTLSDKVKRKRFSSIPLDNAKRELNSAIAHIYDCYKKTLDDIKSTYHPALLTDYDRIIFASSFRRLQDKAQVFPLEKYDYARTRLTHSIEVSSVAAQIGNQIGYKLNTDVGSNKKSNAFNFHHSSATVALLHDLGNPPFGHFGEDTIKSFFRNHWNNFILKDYSKNSLGEKKQTKNLDTSDYHETKLTEIFNPSIHMHHQMMNDFKYFDGNAQGFRVVNKLQFYKDDKSLNLTASVLAGSIKYPFCSIEGEKKEKFGYFYSEMDEVRFLEKIGTYREGKRNPIALILEAADDICNLTSDFDDAVKKGALTYELIDRVFSTEVQFTNALVKKFFEDFYKFYHINYRCDAHRALEITIQRMMNDLKNDLVKSVVKAFLEHKESIMEGLDALNETKPNELLKFTEYKELIKFFKNHFFVPHLYDHEPILKSELEGHEIMSFMLKEFTEAVLSLYLRYDDQGNFVIENTDYSGKRNAKHIKVFKLISKNFVNVYKNAIKNKSYDDNMQVHVYHRLRLVTDYVCGMTDCYAKEIYNVLKGTIA